MHAEPISKCFPFGLNFGIVRVWVCSNQVHMHKHKMTTIRCVSMRIEYDAAWIEK